MQDVLFTADCLDALAQMPDGCAQLVYLDPPFNTNSARKTREASYADSFGSPANYIAYMRPRLIQLRRVLASRGSLFMHCDWRASHYVKVMLDEVFLSDAGRQTAAIFINEIIWRYGLGASRPGRRLLSKHDTIFWYANGPDYTFNLQRGAPTKAMLDKYRHRDDAGNRYMVSYAAIRSRIRSERRKNIFRCGMSSRKSSCQRAGRARASRRKTSRSTCPRHRLSSFAPVKLSDRRSLAPERRRLQRQPRTSPPRSNLQRRNPNAGKFRRR